MPDSLADLPEWVWELLIGLDKWEDEHPALNDSSGNPACCPKGDGVYDCVPNEAWSTARILATYKRRILADIIAKDPTP